MAQRKILIIDDEHSLLRLSQIIFQRKGYAVEVALSVAEGRRRIAERGPFEAIILDLMMPDENGFDFLKWRENQDESLKKTPIIVNTAKNLSEEERNFLATTCDRIMQKGINFSDKPVSEVEALFQKRQTP
jgi:DNA-binding response OmpR family regulator